MKRAWIALLAAALTLMAGLTFAQGADAHRGARAEEVVRTLVERGVLIDFPGGVLQGSQSATHHELAQVLHRFLRQVEEEIRQAGFSPSLAALSPEDLEGLAHAVKELSNVLAEMELQTSVLEAVPKGANLPMTEEVWKQASARAAARIGERLSAFFQTLQTLGERAGIFDNEDATPKKGGGQVGERSALTPALRQDLAALREQYWALAEAVKALSAQVQVLAASPAATPVAKGEGVPTSPFPHKGGEGEFQWGSSALLPVGPRANYGRGRLTVVAAKEDLHFRATLGVALGGQGVLPETALDFQTKDFSLGVSYSGYLPFALGRYLMSNEDPQGTVARTGVKVEGKTALFSLMAVYGIAPLATDPAPSLSGTFWGVRLEAAPLALAYGEASGRAGAAAEIAFREGPFSLEAYGTATAPSGNLPWGSGASLAYGAGAAYEASGLKASVRVYGIDPGYAEGRAGMSQDARTSYYTPPEEIPGTLGAVASLEAEGGFAQVRVGLRSQGDYTGAPGSFSTAFAGNLAFSLFGPFRPFAFYAAGFTGGDGLMRFANPAPYTPGYRYASPERLGATAFGGGVEVAGPVALSLSGSRYPVEGAYEARIQVRADLEAAFRVKAEALGSYFSAPGTPAGSGYLVGIKAEADGGAGDWLFGLKASYGLLLYVGDGASLPFRSGTDEFRLDVSTGYRLGEVLLHGGYLLYRGRNLTASPNPQAEGLFLSWDGSAPPWHTLPGNVQLAVQAFRFGVSSSFLSAEGYLGWSASGPARGFRIAYRFRE